MSYNLIYTYFDWPWDKKGEESLPVNVLMSQLWVVLSTVTGLDQFYFFDKKSIKLGVLVP